MNTNKVEEILQKFAYKNGSDFGKPTEWSGPWQIDPHKLAEVLCEMEERIPRGSNDQRSAVYSEDDNKQYRAGALAVLEDVEEFEWAKIGLEISPEWGSGLVRLLRSLKKKYE